PGVSVLFARALEAIWGDEIARAQTTEAHAAFLAAHALSFELSDRLQRGAHGLFHGGQIHIDARRLREDWSRLVRAGHSPAEATRLAALRALPVVVHEIRHAMIRVEQERRFGFAFAAASLEGEAIAHFDQARIAAELELEHPELFESLGEPDPSAAFSRTVMHQWDRGYDAMLAYVNATYTRFQGGIRSLEDLDGAWRAPTRILDADRASLRQEHRDASRAIRAYLRDLDRGRSAPYRRDELEAWQRDARMTLEALESDERFERVRDYYASLLEEARRDWDHPAWQDWRATRAEARASKADAAMHALLPNLQVGGADTQLSELDDFLRHYQALDPARQHAWASRMRPWSAPHLEGVARSVRRYPTFFGLERLNILVEVHARPDSDEVREAYLRVLRDLLTQASRRVERGVRANPEHLSEIERALELSGLETIRANGESRSLPQWLDEVRGP
ncbi:MAG: hypothetical protein AAF658_02515, partial [Myxococcota bacterium]